MSREARSPALVSGVRVRRQHDTGVNLVDTPVPRPLCPSLRARCAHSLCRFRIVSCDNVVRVTFEFSHLVDELIALHSLVGRTQRQFLWIGVCFEYQCILDTTRVYSFSGSPCAAVARVKQCIGHTSASVGRACAVCRRAVC